MQVRGAPLIGAAAAYGMALAVAADAIRRWQSYHAICDRSPPPGPTAVNLAWGTRRDAPRPRRRAAGANGLRRRWLRAEAIADEDVAINRAHWRQRP
jgi:methylthioribose-1-phosphate isomerase